MLVLVIDLCVLYGAPAIH